ncbi:MAG: ChbG/HpnK family deacetylase [Butyrivibrio sp.]|nr:ChbG/HpnK family deacetylase [Butyrivibrio sp.]
MIEYHADDYGLFKTQSRHIIECFHKGALNGISIMPNSPYLKECMDDIEDIRKDLFVTCHLNFVEGKPLAKDQAGLLTGSDGSFGIGFGKLLLVSYIPFVKKKYQKQLEKEISAQLAACSPYMNNGKYRIDGHVHFHMLPVVFDALMNVIRSENLEVSYIRFPREVTAVYSEIKGKTRDFKPINYLKVFILNRLADRNERKYGEILRNMRVEEKLFMGVMLSGHMFYENVQPCLTKAYEVMGDKGLRDLEILFHPGDVTEPSEVSQITSKDDLDFLTHNSKNREREAQALLAFGEK